MGDDILDRSLDLMTQRVTVCAALWVPRNSACSRCTFIFSVDAGFAFVDALKLLRGRLLFRSQLRSVEAGFATHTANYRGRRSVDLLQEQKNRPHKKFPACAKVN